MVSTVIYADRVLTPLEELEDAAVVVEDGRIVAAGQRANIRPPRGAREYHAEGRTLVPGFVDVHVHGAGGQDVMDGESDALRSVAATLVSFGTTALLATTMTAEADRTCRALECIAGYMEKQAGSPGREPAAEYLGIHLEGPFINPARRGVHPKEWIAVPSPGLLRRFLESAGGKARILTLAPEMPGALELADAAQNAGLRLAMGHTDATYAEARAAIERGARHAVHVFNAMRPFSHRETGVLGAVLTSPEVAAELIADGVHVDAPAMRLLLAAKGAERVILVSDATSATGMPDGQYRLGTVEVTVQGGVCRNAEGRLAGSTLTLDRALRNIVALGVELRDAVRMVTFNPARALGLEKRKGVIEPGADADLVLLGADLRVAGVMTRGVGL